MRDNITAQRVALLHPKIAAEVATLIDKAEAGFPPYMAIRVVQGLRTYAEQNALYAQGRNGDKRPRVTNAKGGQSFHNFGLAVDFAILRDTDRNGTFEQLSWDTAADYDKDGTIDWQEIVRTFTAAGYEWGGSWRTFKDLPHIQKTFGHPIAWYRERYKEGQYVAV